MSESNEPISHFIRNRIDADQEKGTYGGKVTTRFPPEPNGYLHFGHAKSIFLNFGLARDYDGICHLRFDDTNPVKEEQAYVDAIREDIEWLGFRDPAHEHFASDYFETLYQGAVALVKAGLAYVDSQSADEMRANRGTLTEPGSNSPYRDRSIEENLDLFTRMRAGEFKDGEHILRAKIDMAAANLNMRDPAIYRIRHAHHHRTGDDWPIYPMYDYAHCVSDAIEGVTHSLCTLEFEDHRPLYDWFIDKLADLGFFERPLPQQIEFSRLNLTYMPLSKRKLIQLVEGGHVDGWDDPRMPTLKGARRRGFTPSGFKLFTDRIGVSKSDSLIDFGVLEDCMRETLNESAERRIGVLDPLKLVLVNFPEDHEETCFAPNHPQKPDWGKREVTLTRELWIEHGDFALDPPKKYFRLKPDGEVRLRYGFIIKHVGHDLDDDGNVTCVYAEYDPDTKSGTPGADARKVKGNIHWLSARDAVETEIRQYDRLFNVPAPGARREGDEPDVERDFLDDLNPDSIHTLSVYLEARAANAEPESIYQFERHGYFVADQKEHAPGQRPVFNRAVTLRDSWGQGK
ncbi:glutamine--tRNA ligase/YqeY domain fusion protein [Guyparkeria sp. SCN-R1]|uniref:glutamine--tRNA ligase/YqeY domain fusion protein n=1 Tax=Guyparkeria sp. SCN-R1 TaxID=2341113 RepID=UPI000F654A35|nr:glutamine--tRNA ligase/YqeY domain fusion protein [Guyparkeria sp. SCN-R1]RRQ24835.1 glutamine--tRNA ligase/YqeY domain fusion protein [Guyparkeria sp. SCN-R1]